MFGNAFEAQFSLPPVPFDGAIGVEPGIPCPSAASDPDRASISPITLDELTAALDALAELDKPYSTSVASAFSAIGLMFATGDNPGLLA